MNFINFYHNNSYKQRTSKRMMGLSFMSALMIQGNEISVGVYSNKEKTGYGFMIYLMKEGRVHTEIVGTDPYFPFKTEEEARKEGSKLVEEVRKMDLSPQRSKLKTIMGPEVTKVVSQVIEEANR